MAYSYDADESSTKPLPASNQTETPQPDLSAASTAPLAPNGAEAEQTQPTVIPDIKTEEQAADSHMDGQDNDAGVDWNSGQTDSAQNGQYGYGSSESQGIGIKEDG